MWARALPDERLELVGPQGRCSVGHSMDREAEVEAMTSLALSRRPQLKHIPSDSRRSARQPNRD